MSSYDSSQMGKTRIGGRVPEENDRNHQHCLVIFCKRPALSQGKQRLARTLGDARTLVLAKLFLDCAIEDANAWPGPVVISPASRKNSEWAGSLLTRKHLVMPQPEGNLGHRLQGIDQQLRAEGYRKIHIIGTDLPALRPHHYEEARNALDEEDIVLCPVSDGGVSLMAARVPWPELEALPWSTEHLGQALKQHCRSHGLGIRDITSSYDIDVEADLIRLKQDLPGDDRPARRALAAQLDKYFEHNEKTYG